MSGINGGSMGYSWDIPSDDSSSQLNLHGKLGDFPTKFLIEEVGTVKIENAKHASLLQDADTFFANSK
jgi:hypothetical protein